MDTAAGKETRPSATAAAIKRPKSTTFIRKGSIDKERFGEVRRPTSSIGSHVAPLVSPQTSPRSHLSSQAQPKLRAAKTQLIGGLNDQIQYGKSASARNVVEMMNNSLRMLEKEQLRSKSTEVSPRRTYDILSSDDTDLPEPFVPHESPRTLLRGLDPTHPTTPVRSGSSSTFTPYTKLPTLPEIPSLPVLAIGESSEALEPIEVETGEASCQTVPPDAVDSGCMATPALTATDTQTAVVTMVTEGTDYDPPGPVHTAATPRPTTPTRSPHAPPRYSRHIPSPALGTDCSFVDEGMDSNVSHAVDAFFAESSPDCLDVIARIGGLDFKEFFDVSTSDMSLLGFSSLDLGDVEFIA
ncbi:hypothetical protein J8273_3869 [Carpediemonas membranifera]|uniref:Uncharacterized protein n=1 Tax=Carpediemonas membranifera TaxID=201153 RepID=A0A8J6EAF3_9EUKA|nr:hypothetical protein J8273_3869 [Carpediemonas membranifera]|eukprot:KAG9394615.1 hypothetical protein J8273_3869 [Carpediemonas membranifera]